MNLSSEARADIMAYNATLQPRYEPREIILATIPGNTHQFTDYEIAALFAAHIPDITLCGANDCPVHHVREWVTADEARERNRDWMEMQQC